MSSSSGVENYELNNTQSVQDLEKKNKLYDEIEEDDSYDYNGTDDAGSASKFKEIESNSFWYKFMKVMTYAEMKGIQPVTEAEKNDTSLYNAGTMWLSANMVIAAFALGVLGVTVYGLNFGTSVLVIFFFSLLGALPVAFYAVFGPVTGLRQMVLSRYLVGNLTARVFALINCVACVGWGAVNSIASAQLLNMINAPHGCPPWAGCLIIIVITWIVTFFGYKSIHLYEKWSWVPNFIIFIIMIARIAKKGTFTNGAWEGGATTAGNVLSFGCTVFGFAIGWVSYISDYTCYMPKNTNKIALFSSILVGLMIPLLFTLILGAAAAAASLNTPEWQALYNSKSTGGLVYAILVEDSLHGFGQFCCVVLSLSTIANNVPNMYSIALGAQSFWAPLAKVPRPVWTTVGSGITLAIAIAAYYKFTSFMSNFMDSIGYYLSIYVAIGFSEHFIWRKGKITSYNVADWDNWNKLPIGIAGLCALVAGAFGVAVGMDQTYWIGEIGRKIGEYGGDIGFELGIGFSFIIYVIVRPFELKYFGR